MSWLQEAGVLQRFARKTRSAQAGSTAAPAAAAPTQWTLAAAAGTALGLAPIPGRNQVPDLALAGLVLALATAFVLELVDLSLFEMKVPAIGALVALALEVILAPGLLVLGSSKRL